MGCAFNSVQGRKKLDSLTLAWEKMNNAINDFDRTKADVIKSVDLPEAESIYHEGYLIEVGLPYSEPDNSLRISGCMNSAQPRK